MALELVVPWSRESTNVKTNSSGLNVFPGIFGFGNAIPLERLAAEPLLPKGLPVQAWESMFAYAM